MIDILETISIAVIAVTIIAVSLLDSLHILDAFPNWVKSIPQITLAMTGIILGYLLWQRHRYLDELNRELKKGVEDIVSALGGETKIHNGRQQFYDYIVGRIRQAKQRIDIVSPSSYGNSLYSEKDAIYNREFLKAVKDAAKRGVKVRRIRGLHNTELLNQFVDEAKNHLGTDFYVAAYPLRNPKEVPFLSAMIVDNEIAIGGLHRAAMEDVQSITSTHPDLIKVVIYYFDALLSHSLNLNFRSRIDENAVSSLREQLVDELEFIEEADINYRHSAEIVRLTKKRVWVSSTLPEGRPYDPNDQKKSEGMRLYDAAILKLIAENPEIEVRRILRAESEELLDQNLKAIQEQVNYPNFLLNYVLDQRPAIDMLIRDDDILLLGLRDRQSSLLQDSVIVVRNKGFIRVVASWYERYLWTYAIPVKDNRGIVNKGVEKVRDYILAQNHNETDK